MNAVRGRVRAGKVELDTELPEGAEVVVLTGDDEPFELDAAHTTELRSRIAAAEVGHVEPAEVVLARLRSKK